MMPGTGRIIWPRWHLVEKLVDPKQLFLLFFFFFLFLRGRFFCCAKKLHQDPTSAELDSRFLRLVSGRWPRLPAPWSGRNARRGSRTATGSLLRNVAPAPARTPALSARGISWGSSAKSVSAAGRKDPFGGDQVSVVDFYLKKKKRKEK